jgi:hypothetical protein
MADYITPANFKTRHGITVTTDDARIAAHITAASLEVDQICGRQFTADTVATERYFRPLNNGVVWIDDAHTITAVASDEADTGRTGRHGPSRPTISRTRRTGSGSTANPAGPPHTSTP